MVGAVDLKVEPSPEVFSNQLVGTKTSKIINLRLKRKAPEQQHAQQPKKPKYKEQQQTSIVNAPESLQHCDRLIENAKIELDAAWSHIKTAVNAERAAWETEKAMVAESGTFGQKIKLDVGGSKFTTTMTTLQRFPDSMLGAMFSGRHALPLDEDGCYFIDRDGRHFHHILNFLRDPEHFSMEEVTGTAKSELEKEAAYYGLKGLMSTQIPMSQSVHLKSISQTVTVDYGPFANHGYKLQLRKAPHSKQWLATSALFSKNTVKQVWWCRCCGVGYVYISPRAPSGWLGINNFASNRSIPDNQPAPSGNSCPSCRSLIGQARPSRNWSLQKKSAL